MMKKLFAVIVLVSIILFLCLYTLLQSSLSKKLVPLAQRSHHLCIIVPFRDRFNELLQFIPHIDAFLKYQNVKHSIYIINQVDDFRFNRGSLINVGFKYGVERDSCDYMAMHDVDLLPLNDQLPYTYPKEGSFHISAPHLHPRYHYATFIGGILLLKCEDFIQVNGMSNKYWGWGLEDDEFYLRLKEAKIKINRPGKLITNTTNTFWHIHSRHRKRDVQKCYNQREKTKMRDRKTGLKTVNYHLQSVNAVSIDNSKFIILNVILYCDFFLTPWCHCNKTLSTN